MSAPPGEGSPSDGFLRSASPNAAAAVAIFPARPEDIPRVLEIQRAAFAAECEHLGDWNIEPMLQTVEETEEDMRGSLLLKAVSPEGALTGSVRSRRGSGGVFLYKLSVDPAFQRLGIAKALVRAAERALPSRRYWLFTRSDNGISRALYRKLGYCLFKEESATSKLRFAYLEKFVSENPAAAERPDFRPLR
jgi:ribosomal protein S18 acetylase RimI-like enzyme